MARPVRWDLIADPTRYVRGFDAAERRSRSFQRHQTGLQRTTAGVSRALGVLGGAFAAIQVGQFLKGAITEARDAARVTRQTNAVIKATGGVAKVSAKDVDRLATSLSRKLGVDDDVIAAGQNMLLTFKGVRTEVGKGNDIFARTTAVALDMTAALNQGEITQSNLEQTTMRLGKALNDPIKGISALTRVGVTFTDAQKDQIKTLVENGKTMDAQKIILGELTSEFGGAAAAAADPWQRVQVVMDELKERLGTALLPMLEKAAIWLGETLPAAFDKFERSLRNAKQWIDDNRESLTLIGEVLQSIFTPAVKDARTENTRFQGVTITLKGVLTTLLTVLLYATKAWLGVEAVINANISVLASFITAAGHAVNAVDRLRGGSGHAGDAMVAFGQKLKTTARVELEGIQRDARDAQAAIDAMHGKTLHFTTVWNRVGVPAVGSSGRVSPFRALQHGGIVRRPTMALIGEAGPEAVVPLRRSGGNAGVGGGPIHLHISIGGREVGEVLVDPIRKAVRTRGGNVQAVLGSG